MIVEHNAYQRNLFLSEQMHRFISQTTEITNDDYLIARSRMRRIPVIVGVVVAV